jgi:uncharacterized PurR-regulated membrane protein YhhQ (DUF165 family)
MKQVREFGGSVRLFIASRVAYLIGQFLDIGAIHLWKAVTESHHRWQDQPDRRAAGQATDTITINADLQLVRGLAIHPEPREGGR